MLSVKIETKEGSYTENRNGLRDIIAVELEDRNGGDFVSIECVGKGGGVLRGGIVMDREAFENMVDAYQKHKITQKGLDIVATGLVHHERGLEIADLLQLNEIKRGREKGRYVTTYGAKTPAGLYRTIERVINKDFKI